jgi:hypothetical protein
MDCPSKEMLARMPLAESVMWLWRWVTSAERLQSIWDAHRGRCYERVISFEVMVSLIADALLSHESGRHVFEQGVASGELSATIQAAYRKLARLPIAVSEAFLSEGTAALMQAFPEWAAWQGPKSLREFRVEILDGKAIKKAARRLVPLRGQAGRLIAGRALVGLDWSTGLAIAFRADPDGHCNEVKYTKDVVPLVRERIDAPRLWVEDRAFADLQQTAVFTAVAGDHFLTRYAARVPFERDTSRAEQAGQDEHGRSFVESWGWLGSEKRSDRRYLRRIQLKRPKQDDIVLITDLLDAGKYPAIDLLWLYAERWGIERVFQEVTEVFGLLPLIGTTPEAAVFQFSFCLLIYNMMQVIRGYLAQAQDREPDELSTEKLFDDVERQMTAWNVMLDIKQTHRYFQPLSGPAELRNHLKRLLGSAWTDLWLKSPKQLVHNKTPIKKQLRAHHSVFRLLQAHREKSDKQRSRLT